jgi:hypothetical protein
MSKSFLVGIAALLAMLWVGQATAGVIILDDFDDAADPTLEGRFAGAPNASGTSTGFFLNTTSTADRVSDTPAHSPVGSQRIFINDDPATDNTSATVGGEWLLRHLSGGATATNNDGGGAAPDNSPAFTDSTGMIGYWYKTTTAGLEGAMIIDEASAGTSNERAAWKPLVADGNWHALEWSLDAVAANTDWFNFSGGNGLPDQTWATVDALLVRKTTVDPAGGGDFDAEFFIDDVSRSTVAGETIVPEPTSLALAACSALLLGRRRRS